MAISYPRDLPELFHRPVRFSLHMTPIGSLSRTVAGAVNFQEWAGGGLWEAALETAPFRESEYGIAHAFILSLRGGARSFKLWDLRRPWPLHYGPGVLGLMRAGGGGFDGSFQVTAAGGEAISLANLPSGYRVREGDKLSFDWRGGRVLVEALEDRTAGGDGVLSGLVIAPWLLAGGSVPTTGTVVRAWCVMKPKPGSWSGERTTLDPVAFEAIQTLG